MKKNGWSFEFIFYFSCVIFIIFLFNYPKTVRYIFFNIKENGYIISDLNRFTKIYIYVNIFFVYHVYIPFFRVIIYFRISNLFSTEINYFIIRMVVGFVYCNSVSLFFNYCIFYVQKIQDLSVFFNEKIKAVDLTYTLMQYYGLYWDFFIISFVFISLFIFVRDNPTFTLSFILYQIKQNYSISLNQNHFWASFCSSWLFRFYIYGISLYFFYGQGFVADIIINIVIILMTEITLSCIRFTSLLQILKLLIILVLKIFKDIFLSSNFSYIVKSIMKQNNSP